jgi:hypothetical protein
MVQCHPSRDRQEADVFSTNKIIGHHTNHIKHSKYEITKALAK